MSRYEKAARKAGWTRDVGRFTGTVTYSHPVEGRCICFGWQHLCEVYDIPMPGR